MKRACFIVLSVAFLLCRIEIVFAQEASTEMVEWPYVGADQAASKYSPLADINTANVDQLEIAWTWEPNELPNQESVSYTHLRAHET